MRMTKRRDTTSHEECLRHFSESLRKEIKTSLRFWQSQNPTEAEVRQVSYSTVVKLLKDSADLTGVPLQDLGMEDYDVPKLRDAG